MEGEPLRTVLALLPAMVANGSATMVARGSPLDFRRLFIDGKRLLGDGKTFEGTAVGLFYGSSFAVMLSVIVGRELLIPGLLSCAGAMLGDIAGSFLKRRLGLPRGAKMPVVDQLDFALGSLLLLHLSSFPLHAPTVILMLVLIYAAHRLTNKVAYRLGLKTVPW